MSVLLMWTAPAGHAGKTGNPAQRSALGQRWLIGLEGGRAIIVRFGRLVPPDRSSREAHPHPRSGLLQRVSAELVDVWTLIDRSVWRVFATGYRVPRAERVGKGV